MLSVDVRPHVKIGEQNNLLFELLRQICFSELWYKQVFDIGTLRAVPRWNHFENKVVRIDDDDAIKGVSLWQKSPKKVRDGLGLVVVLEFDLD